MPRLAVLAVLAATALVAAACSGATEVTDGPPDTETPATPHPRPDDTDLTPGTPPAPDPAPAHTDEPGHTPEFVVDPPSWRDCGGGMECATLQVPLDHSDPEGALIELALARRPARDGDRRIGALVVNPGGPGASGVALARTLRLDSEVHAHFDIVGWDPRGVGGSTPLGCNDTLLDFYRLDPSPASAAEQAALEAAAAGAAAACDDAAGELLAHLTTEDTIADLELIRRALGEDRLNYLGYSYGSRIGLGYADRYGPRVRTMVLDGVLDPTQELEEWLTDQALAVEGVLDQVLATCHPGCGFDPETVFDRVQALAERGELTAGGEPVGPAALATGAIMASYSPSLWPELVAALGRAEQGDGSLLRDLAELYLGLAGFDAYTAVVCIDDPRPADAAAFAVFARRLADAAPRVGARVANELLPCAFWPVPASGPTDPVSASEAPTIVLVAVTGDAATPYPGALRVAERLDDARLVTFDGQGHTVYGSDRCVDDLVNAYLIELVVPPEGAVCHR